jgi:tetratricopeptide (TPR) repeat protein
MNKSFIAISVVALGLIALLYSLPKVVVGNKKKNELKGTANRDIPKADTNSNVKTEVVNHVEKLTLDQQATISRLTNSFTNAKGNNKVKEGEALSLQFAKYQRYDSAGFYAEKLCTIEPNEKNWLTTANYYYQAFTYAVDNEKGQKMGEKAREYYQKVLTNNPNQLFAKTNMAMTYVGTQTPMAGIMLLREVVAENPDFEPAVFNLGLLSMKSNQFAKAVERFKHIVNNNPSNTKAAFYLGVSLVRLGRNDEAKKILLQVKDKDKDEAVQAELKSILSEIN